MRETVTLLAAATGAGTLLWIWKGQRLRRLARERLQQPASSEQRPAATPEEPFVRFQVWIAPLAGVVVFGVLFSFVKMSLIFATTFALIAALLAARMEAGRVARRRLLIESQLADALDLMIASLRGGGGVLSALELAARETRSPLKEQLQEILGRVRYGDDPQEVLRAFERRVPLETFRLFCASLSVHWEVGGNLAPLLSTVGRTIRDRIELARRVRSLTTQSRVSTIAIMLTTYLVAAVVWRNDPQRMEAFLSTTIGQQLVAFALVLQALGIVWSSSISKMRF